MQKLTIKQLQAYHRSWVRALTNSLDGAPWLVAGRLEAGGCPHIGDFAFLGGRLVWLLTQTELRLLDLLTPEARRYSRPPL